MIQRAAFLFVLGVGWSSSALGQEAEDAGAPPAAVPAPVAATDSATDAGPAGLDAVPDESGLESLLSETVGSAASKSAESGSDAPATTWSISGTDLKRYGIQSIEEAIRFLGHGMVSYEYDDRNDAAFGARGYNSDNLGQNVAILINGNQAGGSAKTARGTQAYMLPIELVDHIEVILGPGSVIYGNSAMLGVINVVTRSGASIGSTNVVVQGSAGLPADRDAKDLSWGEVWGRSAIYGGFKTRLGDDDFDLAWHWGTRWNRQEGRNIWHNTGDPYSGPSAWTPEPVFNRDLETKLFGRATWGHWTFMGWLGVAWQTGIGPIETGAPSSTFEPEFMLDATYAKPISDRGELSWRFYAVVFDSYGKLVPYEADPAGCQKSVGDTFCYNVLHYMNFRPFVEPMFTWDWNNDGSQVTTLGGQLFVDGSYITERTFSSDGQTGKDAMDPVVAPLPNIGAYVQHVMRGSWGSLNLGVRGDLGIIGQAVSPRVAYTKGVWEGGTFKALVSTGFRTPTITERFLKIEGFLTDNPNIKPESVQSAEVNLAQRLGNQNLQVSIFATQWSGIISTATTHLADCTGINQFTNLREIISAGVNVGWRGATGPVDWALSANYAPGRVRLPGDVAQYSEQQLSDIRFYKEAIDRYGQQHLFGYTLFPVGGMPDFYATGHVSYSFGEQRPRLSVAATVSSPTLQVGVEYDPIRLDPRNVDGPMIPWSVQVRGAVEVPVSEKVGFRLIGTWRNTVVPEAVRVGNGDAPHDVNGVFGVGSSSNPVAPLSIMAEASVRL